MYGHSRDQPTIQAEKPKPPPVVVMAPISEPELKPALVLLNKGHWGTGDTDEAKSEFGSCGAKVRHSGQDKADSSIMVHNDPA
jgi:hypothetical protein